MNFGEIFKNSFKYHTLNFKKLLILGIFFLIYGILTALGIYWMFSTELFKTYLMQQKQFMEKNGIKEWDLMLTLGMISTIICGKDINLIKP